MQIEHTQVIVDAVDKVTEMRRTALMGFLNLLFWRDCLGHYVDVNDRCAIIELMDTAKIVGTEPETWIEWNDTKGLELANKIRKQIGLRQLTKQNGYLQEVCGDLE